MARGSYTNNRYNPAEKMKINVNQLNSHWMATGEQVYLDLLKKQILAWAIGRCISSINIRW